MVREKQSLQRSYSSRSSIGSAGNEGIDRLGQTTNYNVLSFILHDILTNSTAFATPGTAVAEVFAASATTTAVCSILPHDALAMADAEKTATSRLALTG